MSSVSSLFAIKNERFSHINTLKMYCSSISQDLVLKYNENTQKFKNIFPLIYHSKNLEQAWYEIKNNYSNKVNRDLKLLWFKELSKILESNNYNYCLERKVLISNPGKLVKKILSIGSPRDKVVQRAFLRVLQPIYEGAVS